MLLVCKNPGHLLPDKAALYQATAPADLARVHIGYAARTFGGENDTTSTARRSTTFHKNLVRYVSSLLDIEVKDVFKHTAYTNLVKCSGEGERESLKAKMMSECFRRHFTRELEFFRPRVLLAFGREVERFLIKAKQQGLHSLQVVYLKHPSYYYKREAERLALAEAKTLVRRCAHLSANVRLRNSLLPSIAYVL